MKSMRYQRAHGQDMGGASKIGQVAAEKQSAPATKKMMKREFDEPQRDVSVSGSGVAHTGKYGAPTIYEEAPGGREGGRGKRVPKKK